jgi:hypothetical protein
LFTALFDFGLPLQPTKTSGKKAKKPPEKTLFNEDNSYYQAVLPL